MSIAEQQEAASDPIAARRQNAKRRKATSWRDRWPPLAAVAGIILVWELIVVGFSVPTYIAPGPVEVVTTVFERWSMLMMNLWPTVLESVTGFVVGNVIAVLIAVVFVHSRFAERAFYPIAVFINTIPIIAIAPILVLLFGNGFLPKIIIAALICFFPTLVNVTRGLKAVNPATLELMHVLSASRWEVLMRVRLPSSLPFLFAALKIASTTCVIGAIVGEWIGSNVGLGALIIEATYNFRSPLLYATVILAALLAVILFSLVSFAERKLIRWKVDAAAV
ncbi:MAG: ABC transporter permease [Pseudomonadota bacterium]